METLAPKTKPSIQERIAAYLTIGVAAAACIRRSCILRVILSLEGTAAWSLLLHRVVMGGYWAGLPQGERSHFDEHSDYRGPLSLLKGPNPAG